VSESRALLEQAAAALAGADRVAVSSGAGISKESGIPTFRDAQTGLWAQYRAEDLATPEAFRRDPDRVWAWYQFRLERVMQAAPNPGHHALVELEELVTEVVILTQNIDSLHRRAGSRDVVELHGNITRFKCFGNCRGDPTLIDLAEIEHDSEHVPTCPHCESLIRPDVVWFGEALPADALERALEVASHCDVMLVVGTSGLVQPAASLPYVAREHGARVIEINPEPSAITPVAQSFLQGPSGQILPQLIEKVRLHQEKVL
jgi:NAD-dependent deacetylase